MLTIRPAVEADIPRLGELLLQICRVYHECRPDLFRAGGRKYSDSQLRTLLREGERPVLVAEDGSGLVVGYAICAYERCRDDGAHTDMTTLYLDDLCVDEGCRGQGIGSALYRAVLDLARDAGCYNVTLNVWPCNPGAVAFYEKCGMKVQKIGMEAVL